MKKLIALLLVSLALLSLSACGEKAKTPASGVAGTSVAPAKQPDAQTQDVGQMKVEVKGDKIIATSSDGLGNESVSEYIYKDGALSEAVLTMVFPDSASAKKIVDSMKNGDLKQTADSTYSEIKQDGKKVICKMNDNMLAIFSPMSQNELAAMLNSTPPAPVSGG